MIRSTSTIFLPRLSVVSIVPFAVLVALTIGTSISIAQDTGGFGGGGDDLANDIFDAVEAGGGVGGGAADTGNNTTNNNTGNTGASTGDAIGGDLSDIFGDVFEMEIEVAPNERVRGFVGSSATAPDENHPFQFVGPRADQSSGNTGGTTGGRTTGNAGRGGGGAGGGTQENGFRVQRATPIRSRLVARFRSTPPAPRTTANQVNVRLSQLPATRQFSQSMNVTMDGRTAIISGTARNQEQVNRIKGQLRFEPRVLKIEDRVQIVQ